MLKELLRDSFFLGILIGLAMMTITYYTFVNYDEMMGQFTTIRIKLYPPRLQLIILALTLILFRFMMVKWNMIKTGKGLFLTIFLITMIYFFNHRYKFF
jgi:hypothetical protein